MKLCPVCHHCYEDTDTACVYGEHGMLAPSRPGSRIIADKYRLERLLGRGGMGAVYVGTHIELERPAAIKLLLPDLVADPQSLERFRREARAAARLNHPNVADTYDYGILLGGEAYIVMELVEGQTLREYINAEGMLDFGEAVTIARQVSDGVEVAHRNGIIHRDLKPSNIILSRDHHDCLQAKVVDFGIAKLKEYSSTGGTGVLTSTGSLVGTPRYMSPEQCAGHEIDARSDIYSLGVILYEMLAGKPPFDAPSATAIAIKHVQETPPPIQDLRPTVPDALASLVMQTLAKDPSERPQTASELSRHLRPIENRFNHSEAQAHDGHVAATTSTDRAETEHRASAETSEHRQFLLDTASVNAPVTESSLPLDERQTNRAGSPTLETELHEDGQPTDEDQRAEADASDALSLDEEIKAARSLQAASEAVPGDEAARVENSLTGEPSQLAQASAPASVAEPETITRASAAHVAHVSTQTPDSLDEPLRADSSAPAPSPSSGQGSSHRSAFLVYAIIAVAVVIGLGALLLASRRGSRQTPDSATSAPLADQSVPASHTTNAPRAAETNATGVTNTSAPASLDNSNAASPTTPANTSAVSPDAERQALRTTLDAWVAATNSRDTRRQMSFYMPTLSTYYRSNNVSRSVVQRDKLAVIGSANFVQISTSEPVINLSRDGQTATMTFHKQYVIEGGAQGGRGEVVQELLWRKTDGGWKIVGERDRQILR